MDWEEIAKKEQERAKNLEETLHQIKELLEEERKESAQSFQQLEKLKEKVDKRAETSEKNLQRLITAVKQDKAKSIELEKKTQIDWQNKLDVAEERIKFLEEQLKKEGNQTQDIIKIQKQMEEQKLSSEEKISTLNMEISTLKSKLQITQENNQDLSDQLDKALEMNRSLKSSTGGSEGSSSEEVEKYKKQAESWKDKSEKLQVAMKKLQEKTVKMVELVNKERKEQQVLLRNSNNPLDKSSTTSSNNDNEKIRDLENTISDLRSQLNIANEKIKSLEQSGGGSIGGGDVGGFDAPPPPPPPLPVIEIKPVTIVIKKKMGEIKIIDTNPKAQVIKPNVDFIQELKKGIELKKTNYNDERLSRSTTVSNNENSRGRTMTNSDNPMGMISQMAMKLAQERNSRLQEGNLKIGPVRSKRLDNLLDRIN